MTTTAEQTIAILADTMKQQWWVPSDTQDLAGLRRAALEVLATGLTPERRFLQLLGSGAFGEAEGLLEAVKSDLGMLGELTDAVERLQDARTEALRRTTTKLDILRHRSDRLGRPWDEELASLLASMSEDDDSDAQSELAQLADDISLAEQEMATALLADGARLDADGRDFLRDLVAETQWDAARHLIEHRSHNSTLIDRPTTPPLARLGVAPAALFRSLGKGRNPSQPSDGWRELDQPLANLVCGIPATGPAQALAEALRCEPKFTGDITTLRAVFTGTRAATVAVTDIHLHPTDRSGELSAKLEGFETEGVLSLERTLQVLLSPGDRSWQLLRAIVAGWPVEAIFDITQASAPTIDRIEAVLDLALRAPQAPLAMVVAHRAGFNSTLAEGLLRVALPLAGSDGRIFSDDLDRAMQHPDLISAWQRTMAEFAQDHQDAYLLLTEAASAGETTVDSELIGLLAEVAGVQNLETALEDLEAAGFASPSGNGMVVLHTEPMRLVAGLGEIGDGAKGDL